MKFVIVAGTPGSGKTSVMLHVINYLKSKQISTTVSKIDCLCTDDSERYAKTGVEVIVGLSKDMCPDHFGIYNSEDLINIAIEKKSDVLIVETAGLCHRCSPYTKECIGVCIIDATSGPNTPLKVGPFLSTADIVAITKGDVVSQAEREIFRESVLEMNPNAKIIEVNGLSGKGCFELAEELINTKDVDIINDELRHNAPLAICTLCVGETRIGKEFHRGILRKLDGIQYYVGE
jgi:Ni2+-binding GTPase involved in maturation of urease and hydrogenase